jgi:hypothetical protein
LEIFLFVIKRREVILKVINPGVWSESCIILRLALLLLGVCPLLYNFCENNSANNGVFQGYKGYQDITGQTSGQTSGCVSPFYQPTRHESGSASQIYNLYKDDKVGKLPFICICIKTVHIYKHFEHGVGSIRAILAELEAFQKLVFKAAINGTNSLFFVEVDALAGCGCGLGCGLNKCCQTLDSILQNRFNRW